jgi:benzodiazapine receptor
MKTKDILKLVVSILLCQLAGFVGSLFTTPAIPTWYETLNKPSFIPPNGIFGPVWISLYVLMGISLFLVWRVRNHPKSNNALIFFFVQLGLNVLWSISFFGLRSPLLGLIDIIFLWIAILLTIQNFLKVSRIAGLLLFPYFLWVSFAVLLNLFLWIMNL